jgi:CDP-diacylglycerol--glycerol-3-phosphate 3-phosphatidyltransferase
MAHAANLTVRARPAVADVRAQAHILDRVTARSVSAPLAQIPNALTLGRLALIPVFVALVLASDEGHSWWAAVVFGIAGVTDQVDGYLARRWHVESAFGKLADPLADRLMIDAAVLLLWHAGRLPWIALAIPLRDLVALVGTPIVLGRGYEFQVNLAGKAATWLLYLSLGTVMATHDGTDWPLWIFWAGVVLALGALAQYVVKARREVLA